MESLPSISPGGNLRCLLRSASFLILAVVLSGCDGADEKSKTDAAVKTQVDVAKAALQEKADALARSASIPPKQDPPQQDNK